MTNILTINEICDSLEDGNWIESKDQSKDGIRLIQTGNIKSGYFVDKLNKARYISEKTFNKLNCKEVFEGDILISRLPEPVGRGCILPNLENRSITAVDCSIVRVKKNLINKKYLIYFLQSPQYQFQINKKVTGTTRLRISRKNLGEINIPVPSLQEQEEIVERLDKVFENIDKKSQYKKEKISYTNDFLNSFYSKIFNYTLSEKSRILELSEVADIKSGNSAPQGKEPFVNGKYNFYRTYDVGQIRKGEISESRDKVNEETYSKLKTFPINTILFPKSGASTFNNNRVIIKEEGAIASHLAGIKANPEILNDYYLYYFLLTVDAKDLIQDSAYPSLNLKQISLIEIPLIPIQEQNEIVKQLDVLSNNVKRLINQYREQLLLLSKLKKSILNKEFSYE